jgi:hypothetical protein
LALAMEGTANTPIRKERRAAKITDVRPISMLGAA